MFSHSLIATHAYICLQLAILPSGQVFSRWSEEKEPDDHSWVTSHRRLSEIPLQDCSMPTEVCEKQPTLAWHALFGTMS